MRIRVRSCLAAVGVAALAALGYSAGAAAASTPAGQAASATSSDLAALVNTLTYTSGGGNTFPGADVPFGMVQWSPDTTSGGAGGGYNIDSTSLMGFGLTHLSGPGCGAAGDVPILPMTGPMPSGNLNNVTTPFSHTGEVAQAGYYSVMSNQPSTITSQFTATLHSAMGRFTFPQTSQADFLIKLQDSQTTDFATTAHVVGNDMVTGSDTTGHFCGESNNGGQPQTYTVHFSIVFSQPFTASTVTGPSSKPAAVFLTFNTTTNPVIKAKVGISYVSSANATLNWQTDNPGWSFSSVKSAAQATWNNLLGRIQVSGGSTTQTDLFYSLLYKDFLQPNVTSDVNGQFMGADFKVHTLASGQQNQYGIYSGWDIYHSLAQLQAMLDPSAASDMITSQLNYYAEDGLLQQWGYLQDNNFVMVGDPMLSIIADYYAFGGTHVDAATMLKDLVAQATSVNEANPGYALEQKYGYLPQNGTYGCCHFHGTVATLLENDTSDLAVSFLARSMGDTATATMLESMANNWANLFNPSNGLLTSRYENGQFVPGVGPLQGNNGNESYYVEGDAYEYLWDVPNDYRGLFNALGGNSKVVPALQKYLSQPNGFGMYAELSNEFDLGEQMALDYAGDPAGTQAVVNNIRNTLYQPGPSGFPNNDDLGAESSQYIWEMLGMYPENPGSGNLVFASPGFPHAAINLPNGKTITINAPGASPTDFYVQQLFLNGSPYEKLYVPYSQLSAGATLDFQLGTQPSTWGSAPMDAPPSYTAGLPPAIGYTSTGQVTVAPGGSTTFTVGAQNLTHQPQKVQVTASPPSGVTVSPSSVTIPVPPDGSATATLTVSAAASTVQNFYSMPVSFSDNGTSLKGMDVTVLVASPGSLLRAFNNAGVSNNNDVGEANFDGGGTSYSAQALATTGVTPSSTVTSGALSYTWPVSPPGYPDNVMTNGQTITVNAPTGTRQIGFLGSASNGPSRGIATLTYSDGSTSQYWLGLSDWTLNGGSASGPSYGNQIAISLPYRNCSYCNPVQQSVKTYIYSTSLPVNPSKTLTSVTLPSGATQGTLHVFAIGTSTTPMTPPELDSLSPATASVGQVVTVHGSGFGATQGSSYVRLQDNGVSWGCGPCGNLAGLTVDSWSNTAVSFTVPAAGPYGSVYPGSEAMVTVGVAGANGNYAVSDGGVLAITPTSNPADYYDNAGITPDNNTTCSGAYDTYDGVGYAYSATALANAGLSPGATVKADGLTFTWPDVQPCNNDNMLASGQTMLLSGSGNTLGFIGSSTDGGSQGTVTIHYTDGTSSTATLSFNDWAAGPGSGDVSVAEMPYRNYFGGQQAINIWVYAATVPVNPNKTVAAITFPFVSSSISGGATSMHIFAVSLGTVS